MLIPRLSTVNREALHNSSTAKAGLLVFDSDLGSFFIYGKTAKGIDGWVDLSNGGNVWKKTGNNIYLANSNYNVGIGTNTPSKKFVLKATNDSDTLLEIQDRYGKPLMLITPTLTKFYFNQSAKKGIAGGFAVGRYATAKADISDTALFIVTPDSTRVYTSGTASTVEAGGFAVGRYATAKGSPIKFFNTNIHNTRIYTDGAAKKGIAGGFAVGRYATAKGTNANKYFYADIDSTRIYTNGGSTKGIAGGFAVGRYATAKDGKAGATGNYMYMKPENYFIGDSSGLYIQQNPLTAIGKYNTFFGYQSGMNNNIGGSNVFIGYKSGLNTVGEIITSPSADTLGARNVFLGFEAGYNNTKGSDNVLLGYQAGHENTTAGNVIALGSGAGYNNADNSDNIFLGRNAGFYHTGTGNGLASNNIYIGTEAGEATATEHNTGQFNIFLGNQSGKYNSDGGGNVFMGNQAGLNNKGGNENICIGKNSGKGNQMSSRNIFMGTDAAFSHTTGDQNVVIGMQAFGFNISGNDNLIMGYQAAVGHPGYTGNAQRNVILGKSAGALLDDAVDNVFIGHLAGEGSDNTNGIDGDANVIIGEQAGHDLTSGSDNTFIGTQSGEKNKNGSENTFLGKLTGSQLTAGNQNTFLGCYAGEDATGGNQNIFIGLSAGQYQSSGDNNIYLGNSAGVGSITSTNQGSENVFLGTNTGSNNTSGTNNVFLGYEAGLNNKQGSNNVFLGTWAGEKNEGDGSPYPNNAHQNVFIGYSAGRNNVSGGSNTYVGNSAGHYNNGAGNVCVGEAAGASNSTTNSAGNVYIGKNAAWDKGNGDDNVIIGHNAGRQTEAGKENVIIGNAAGWNILGSGITDELNYNVIIGNGAAALGLGSNNVVVGNDAGKNLTPTTSVGNVLLGYGAGFNETGSNKLYIENSDNDNTSALIYGEFDNNILRINGELEIGTAYSFPTSAGTSGQALITNGAGNQASWQSISSGTITAANGLSLSGGNQVQLGSTSSSGSPLSHISYVNLSSYDMIFNMNGTGDFEVRDNNATCLYVEDNGRVGIGTASPSSKLHVNGDITLGDDDWIGMSSAYIRFDSSGDDIEILSADIGIGTSDPENLLHVYGRGNDISIPEHIEQIENYASERYSSVLALKLGNIGTGLTNLNNFITFFDGNDNAVGAIEGNGSGGVSLHSGSADFAEYLEKINISEQFKQGDIVGVYGGKISKNTKNADMIMAISTAPIVLGNNPGETKLDEFEKVGFIGQVPVNVIGKVKKGDYIIASGKNDGVGFAVSENNLKSKHYNQILGIAWESSSNEKLKQVLTGIGLNLTNKLLKKQNDAIFIIEKNNEKLLNENKQMKKQIENIQKQIQELKNLIKNK